MGEGGHGDVEEEGGQHDDGTEGDRTGLAVGLGVIGAGNLEELNIFVKWKCVSFFFIPYQHDVDHPLDFQERVTAWNKGQCRKMEI